MISSNITLNPFSKVNGKVELYSGSTLVTTCTCEDRLQDFTVERIGQGGKFFGFGIIHKLNINLIDLDRTLTITKGNSFKVFLGVDGDFVNLYPTFYAEEIERDENTNTISIVAYDALYQASAHTYSELPPFTEPYMLLLLATRCAIIGLGLKGIKIPGVTSEAYGLTYEVEGNENIANLNGSEDIRTVLNALAEAFQSIYYVDAEDNIVFKRLDKSSDPVLTITKEDYFALKTGDNVAIEAICHHTELGDNVSTLVKGVDGGVTQYVRDNPFWTLRTDIDTILENAFAAVDGLSINQFTCEEWVGNYLLEIGDKIAFETENGETIVSYILSDVISFDGALSESTEWKNEDNSAEDASNPVGLGEALNQTFARVDKVNREIKMYVSEVESIQEDVNGVNNQIGTLTRRVESTMTPEEVQLQISTAMEQGAEKVETSTGYTFNEQGLHISKSGSGVENLIDNTGMYVKRDGTDILVANTNGVEATNLHAKTYLIIGENSRFEDYYNNGNRTGCFFIGG